MGTAVTNQRWPFYVYEFMWGGHCVYVGKGSGQRLSDQCRTFGFDGYEVARFRDEADAYTYEIERIKGSNPWLNISKGGNGPVSVRGTIAELKASVANDKNYRIIRIICERLVSRAANGDVDAIREIMTVKPVMDKIRQAAALRMCHV